jgi:hypothetical protein
VSKHHKAAAKGERKASKAPGRRELRKYLEGLDREELIEQVMQLSADFAPVRELYQARLSAGDDTETRAKYKRIIDKEFRLFGNPRVSVARKAVLDYQKVAGSVEGVADLMIYYVECGVTFASSCGYDVASFYDSMATMWHNAMLHIGKHELQSRFKERCERVLRAADRCGYGLAESLDFDYVDVFGFPDEE